MRLFLNSVNSVMVALLWGACALNAAENEVTASAPKFLGASSCSSSGCHGGATTNRNQNLIWSRHDFHTRSYATLTTRRSERLGEVLKLGDAFKSQRCTVCHAPFHEVSESRLAAHIQVTETVSCESCHGPAEGWLRTHTRPDLTYGERVQAGMRDLKNLYVRANTCVPCHQTVKADLLAAGHPELIFELDGQAVTEPKHWREKHEWIGPQAWLVGQAVALREMSWQLSHEPAARERVANSWSGLLWLLQTTEGLAAGLPSLKTLSLEPTAENFAIVQRASDELARRAADQEWNRDTARKYLVRLAGTSEEFKTKSTSRPIQARRAERLVLALDRLLASLTRNRSDETLEAGVNQLFKLSQSLPDFDATGFADTLEKLSRRLNESDLVK
jgi:cytochrome c554/c'-like protein